MLSPALPAVAFGCMLSFLFVSLPANARSKTDVTVVPEHALPVIPPSHLNAEQADLWHRGRELFVREWDESEGLGRPAFNGTSCAACHSAPALGGGGANDVNVLGLIGVGGYYQKPDPRDEFIGDVQAMLRGVRSLDHSVAGITANQITERQAPSLYGLALIDTIYESEIRNNVQRFKRGRKQGDRIRGFVSMVPVEGGPSEVGRFGWKAQAPRLADFICMAVGGELGLTAPNQGRGFGQSRDADMVLDPEVSQTDFDALVLFVRELAPPPASSRSSDAVSASEEKLARGQEQFHAIGCANCHVPSLMGSEGPVPLYSDLLMHRVLREVPGRGRRAAPYRTPPLWGVADTAPYMHDGRAATLRDAVLLHAGEAVPTRKRFIAMPFSDQEALLTFVESLPLPRPDEPDEELFDGSEDNTETAVDSGAPGLSEEEADWGGDACILRYQHRLETMRQRARGLRSGSNS